MKKYNTIITALLFITFVFPVFADTKNKENDNQITQKDIEELEYWKEKYSIQWYRDLFASNLEPYGVCQGPSSALSILCYPERVLFLLSPLQIKSLYLHFDESYGDRNIVNMISVLLLYRGWGTTMTFHEYEGYDSGFGPRDYKRLPMTQIYKWIEKGVILKKYKKISQENAKRFGKLFGYEVEIKDNGDMK